MIFQQKYNSKGELEFRTKFGRQKALVLRQHEATGFFYVDLYDNRPGKSDHLGIGMDELDILISIRPNLDSLKGYFKEVSHFLFIFFFLVLLNLKFY